jgi:uncharacterized protein
MTLPPREFDPRTITRPDPALWTHYLIIAGLTVFGFPFVILPLYFKYHTLKYRFDDDGILMSWGILWRREINLTYRRIQDIHVNRGLVQRYLGLASVAIQTASGSSSAEMTIEGIRNPEGLRDFLYQRMRGARGDVQDAITTAVQHNADGAAMGNAPPSSSADETLTLLVAIRDELRQLRTQLTTRPTGGGGA